MALVIVQRDLLEGTVNDGGGLEGGSDLSNASNHFCVKCVRVRVRKMSVKKKEKRGRKKKKGKEDKRKKKKRHPKIGTQIRVPFTCPPSLICQNNSI